MNKFTMVLFIGLLLAGVLALSLWFGTPHQEPAWLAATDRELAQVD